MFSVPAFAYPTLELGQAFNAQTSSPGSSLFEDVKKREPRNSCKYSFNCKVVKTNSDVKDLLDISGDLSLKIKADLLKVDGAGKYLNDRRNEEGVTELLAVMKCTTVCEAIDDVKSVVRGNIASLPSESIGTHYVSSVTYGGEMVASLKFKSLSGDKSNTLHGEVEGKLSTPFGMVTGGLKAQLDKVARECKKESDIEIKYYGIVQPEKLPTNFEDLEQLIENFPKRMREMDTKGRGVPIKFDLQPIQNVGIKHGILYIKKIASATFLKDFEKRYDDLRSCSQKLDAYFSEIDDAAEEVLNLNDSVKEVLEAFNEAIQGLNMAGDRKQLESSNKAYREALGGGRRDGKFMAEWRKVSKNMAPVKHTLKAGRELTVVLFGKAGNGKSATANQIVGEQHFDESYSAAPVTVHSNYFKRKGDREIRVIDTPGIMDTSSIAELKKSKSWLIGWSTKTKDTLNEMAKVFEMAPHGFDAIILVAKYGVRFTLEDSEALKILLEFLGEESKDNIIVVFTHGDDAARNAKREGVSVKELITKWMETLPDWIQEFIRQINDRVVVFDNTLDPCSGSEAQIKQVEEGLVHTIDAMTEGKKPFINKLTNASKQHLDEQVNKAMKASGMFNEMRKLEEKKLKRNADEKELMEVERQLAEMRN